MFCSNKVYKEMEYEPKELKAGIGLERAIEIVNTIDSIKAIKPKSNEPFERILLLTEKQKLLGKCFGFLKMGVLVRKTGVV